MMPSVDAKARDITFEFNNSCNCCCGDDDPLVYVNSHGGVEKFDPKKAQDEREALRRSLDHLTAIMDNKATSKHSTPYTLKRCVSGSVSDFEEGSPKHMSYSSLKKIKEIIQADPSLWNALNNK